MTALALPAPAAVDDGSRRVRRLARTIGALYLVLAVLGMLGPLTLESMLVPGDAAATAANINGSSGSWSVSLAAWVVIVAVDVAISVLLYVLLAPVGRTLSLLAASFRIVYSVVMAALLVKLFEANQLINWPGADAADQVRALHALETFSAGFLVALVFFGVHLVLLGRLLCRSGFVPRFFGPLLFAAGVGYVIDSLASLTVDGYGGVLSAVLLTPAVLGEIGLTLWLLVKGVRVPVTQ